MAPLKYGTEMLSLSQRKTEIKSYMTCFSKKKKLGLRSTCCEGCDITLTSKL